MAADAHPKVADDWGGHVWPKDRETTSPDGTTIRYTVVGADDAPWIVLCAGFMCPDNFWQYLVPALQDRYRFAILNYRSVGASSHPRNKGYRARRLHSDDYTIPKMAQDVGAVIEAEAITDATVLGHSMGCQVAIEVHRQRPHDVGSLVLVTGPYASPLHTFYGSKIGVYLFPIAWVGLPLLPRPVQKAIPKVLRMPPAVSMWAARMIRALGPETPTEGMAGYFEHFSNGDPMIIMKVANGMHRYDGRDHLEDIDVPTLVLIGGRDNFTPPALGQFFVDHVPDCELRELPEGTHGAIIEFPDEVAELVDDFVTRKVTRG